MTIKIMAEVTLPCLPTSEWRELRDERGKLCARVDSRRLLLELHRNHQWIVFDLRDFFEDLQTRPSVLE